MQYFHTCPQNLTYISSASTQSDLDVINILLESKQLKDTKQAPRMSFDAHESKNFLHKDCYSMFVSYSLAEKIVNTSFLSILNLNVFTNHGHQNFIFLSKMTRYFQWFLLHLRLEKICEC